MSLLRTVIHALSLSGVAWAASLPPVQNITTPVWQIQNITRPLSEVAHVIDLNSVVKDFRTSAKPRARGTNTKLVPRDGVACLDTPYGDAPSIGECQSLCEHFLDQPTAVVALNPVHMTTFWSDNAMFAVANLDPCNARSVQHGVLRLWCSDMLERCIANEMDGYYDAESYFMAAALTGDEATPPYYFDDQC